MEQVNVEQEIRRAYSAGARESLPPAAETSSTVYSLLSTFNGFFAHRRCIFCIYRVSSITDDSLLGVFCSRVKRWNHWAIPYTIPNSRIR